MTMAQLQRLEEPTPSWKTSRYTRLIELKDASAILYNGFSGAVLQFSGHGFERVKQLLEVAPPDSQLPEFIARDTLFDNLVTGGFLVDATVDELAILEEDYRREQERSQFLFTIFTTFSCNLGCDYCFVGKKSGAMSRSQQDALVDFIARQMERCQPPSMSVDWMGGEPLLARQVFERLSHGFLTLCAERGIPYSSQVITNGTVLTEDSPAFLRACGVDSLQITLDGPQDTHNARRFYKIGKKDSFDRIRAGLEHVVGKFVVRVRINVDKSNLGRVWPLLDMFADQGWLGPDTRFFPYLAAITPYTEACAFVEDTVAEQATFHEVNFQWMRRLQQHGVPVATLGLYHFPDRKLYNCGAVGNNGFVITPGGELHKCGLTVDDSKEAVGMVDQPLDQSNSNLTKWRDYSPFDNAGCRQCEFLPSCLGGCPRDHMLKREVQIADNCVFHKKFEDQIIAEHLKLMVSNASEPKGEDS